MNPKKLLNHVALEMVSLPAYYLYLLINLLLNKTQVAVEMVSLPAGEFLMGSSKSNPHQAKVNSFAIGKYPITQAQYGSSVIVMQIINLK